MAAGQPLPTQLLVQRPGQSGGPAAAPLLLYYRRDWWRALIAGSRAGSGGSVGGSGGELSDADAAAALPPTWLLLADLVSELLNKDLDGDGQPDHVLCVDLMPGGCQMWLLNRSKPRDFDGGDRCSLLSVR